MSSKDRWLLPEGIEESLPDEAAWLEHYRRILLDVFSTWGYELVIPPLIEYLESLLIGSGDDLDLQTFKLTDQLNGRMMGVRADMTSQVARIDAHVLKREAPSRFCYLGTVLRTRPGGRDLTRSPLQLGAELYGHAGADSDLEVICLMLEALRLVGVKDICLDLGHMGIFTDLVARAGLDEARRDTLQTLLRRKALPEYEQFLSACGLREEWQEAFMALSDVSGDESVIDYAKNILREMDDATVRHVNYIEELAGRIKRRDPETQLHFDFSTLSGYRYHNGTVFAAYVSGQGEQIARGGRYDMIGGVFGRSRPATGFSLDLKALAKISPYQSEAVRGIFAPNDDDPQLHEKIAELRRRGERVVCQLSDQKGDVVAMRCNRVLCKENRLWVVRELE